MGVTTIPSRGSRLSARWQHPCPPPLHKPSPIVVCVSLSTYEALWSSKGGCRTACDNPRDGRGARRWGEPEEMEEQKRRRHHEEGHESVTRPKHDRGRADNLEEGTQAAARRHCRLGPKEIERSVCGSHRYNLSGTTWGYGTLRGRDGMRGRNLYRKPRIEERARGSLWRSSWG